MAEGPVAEGELRDPPSRPKAPQLLVGSLPVRGPSGFWGCSHRERPQLGVPGDPPPPPHSPGATRTQLPAQHGVMQGGRTAAGPARYETPQKHRGGTGRGSSMPPTPGPVPPHRAQLPPTGPGTPFRTRYPLKAPPGTPKPPGSY